MTSQKNSLNPTAILNDASYTAVRRSATLFLPAIGALYFTIAQIWNLPYAAEVVGTVAALNIFAGVLATVAKKFYDATGVKYDGSVDVKVSDDGSKQFLLNLNGDPNELDKKTEIVFKVNSN